MPIQPSEISPFISKFISQLKRLFPASRANPVYFAGIGTRFPSRFRAPLSTTTNLITDLSEELAHNNYILRTGAAPGVDTLFEHGFHRANSGHAPEIFLPNPEFFNYRFRNSQFASEHTPFENTIRSAPHTSIFNSPSIYAKELASLRQLHRGTFVDDLQSRNMHQILGPDPHTSPASSFVLALPSSDSFNLHAGGTRNAMHLAIDSNIPTYDLASLVRSNLDARTLPFHPLDGPIPYLHSPSTPKPTRLTTNPSPPPSSSQLYMPPSSSTSRPPNSLDIGRSGIKSGLFGSPFPTKKGAELTGSTLPDYEAHLVKRLADPSFRAEFLKLKGKPLWCPGCGPRGHNCAPGVCHGSIILKYLNNL